MPCSFLYLRGECFHVVCNEHYVHVRFQVLTVVSMKLESFGMYCREVKYMLTDVSSSPRWWRQYSPLKRRSTSTWLHGSTSQETLNSNITSAGGTLHCRQDSHSLRGSTRDLWTAGESWNCLSSRRQIIGCRCVCVCVCVCAHHGGHNISAAFHLPTEQLLGLFSLIKRPKRELVQTYRRNFLTTILGVVNR
jgi:hypothetical protein